MMEQPLTFVAEERSERGARVRVSRAAITTFAYRDPRSNGLLCKRAFRRDGIRLSIERDDLWLACFSSFRARWSDVSSLAVAFAWQARAETRTNIVRRSIDRRRFPLARVPSAFFQRRHGPSRAFHSPSHAVSIIRVTPDLVRVSSAPSITRDS